LRYTVPLAELDEVVYGGKLYSPAEARELGLVNEVAPPDRLLQRAWDVAERLARSQPLTFRLNKSREREPVVELAARDPAREEEIDRAWSAPEAFAAIRAHLEAVARRG